MPLRLFVTGKARREVWIAWLVAAAIGLGIPGTAHAGWEDGWAAYERGRYVAAFNEWLPLAHKGHADAQYNLAYLYEAGQGVEQDLREAIRWYLAAAEQGHADAQVNLGYMYDVGKGVEQDYATAIE